jgi:hypothetical protein
MYSFYNFLFLLITKSNWFKVLSDPRNLQAEFTFLAAFHYMLLICDDLLFICKQHLLLSRITVCIVQW